MDDVLARTTGDLEDEALRGQNLSQNVENGAAITRSGGREDAFVGHAGKDSALDALWRDVPCRIQRAGAIASGRRVGQFTISIPPATSATAAAKPGVITSPMMKWPAATPNNGVRNVKAESSPAR